MGHEHERTATDGVEWLSALWELTEEGEPRCANRHLLTLLQFSPALRAHDAFDDLARVRRSNTRDQLIKSIVRAAYGETTPCDALHRSTQALARDAESVIGAGPSRLIDDACADARRRVHDLAGGLDPAADLAPVIGERLPLRVVVSPSVFLPPPQAGRHGVLVRQRDDYVAHLHFGFPLRQDPEHFGITREWLLGGAWHYTIDLYLRRVWPSVEQQLRERGDLLEALSAAMRPAERPWTESLQAHVNVALKCLVARRHGVPDAVHRAFAKASGLVLFSWFERWLLESGAGGAALADHIAALPDALAASRSEWERLGRAEAQAPPTINLALISPSTRRACVVVPDEWSGDTTARALAGWRMLRLPIVPYGEWARTRIDDGGPVIAFGEPDRNPLVRRVLEQRGLSLTALDGSDPAIIALSSAGFEQAPWCIAVAVTRPETSAALHMEMVLQQTSTYIVLDGRAILHSGRVPVERLFQ